MTRRLRHLIGRIRTEGGIALPLALAITVVLGISVTASITYTSSNTRTSYVSKSRDEAYHFAEAGLNNAINVIHHSDSPRFSGLLPPRTTAYDNGSVTWSGTIDDSDPNVSCPGHLACWNITSTGIARNPTGATSSKRTLTIKVPLDPVYTQPLVNDVYDYVFVYGTGDPSGCDFTNSNNTTFDSRLYVEGNLCISNSTAITNELQVWGTAAIASPASIGLKSGSTITYNTKGVHIKNGCATSSAGPSGCRRKPGEGLACEDRLQPLSTSLHSAPSP